MNKRIAKLASSLGVTAALVVGGVAATATPAAAATSTSFCFTWYTGAAYANYPVELHQVDAAGKSLGVVRRGKTGAGGCGTFSTTPSNVRLRVAASLSAGGQYFAGWTPSLALPGQGGANLGSAYVYRVW